MQDVVDEKAQSESTNKEDGGYKLKFCTVCASNQNRSVYLGLTYIIENRKWRLNLFSANRLNRLERKLDLFPHDCFIVFSIPLIFLPHISED